MQYLKILSRVTDGDVTRDHYALYAAAEGPFWGDQPYVTWIKPYGGTGSYYRGDFVACWILSETGGTLDKIRGFTPEEVEKYPRD